MSLGSLKQSHHHVGKVLHLLRELLLRGVEMRNGKRNGHLHEIMMMLNA